jgi:hypothetical protein
MCEIDCNKISQNNDETQFSAIYKFTFIKTKHTRTAYISNIYTFNLIESKHKIYLLVL